MRAILSLLAMTAALATAGGPQPPAKDPQAKIEPRSGPGAGQKFLERFVGDWAVEKAFFPAKGDPIRTSGTCRQEMAHGGRFLQCEFTFDPAAGKTTGTGVIGFDPATNQFTSVWYDSRQTKMSFRQSKNGFDGSKIVLEAAGVGGPPARTSRTETTLSADGGRITHRQFNPVSGGGEHLLMELVLTRKPAAGR